MSAMAKFSEQVRIARETGTFVVLAASEAQAVLDELDHPSGAQIRCPRCGQQQTIKFSYAHVPDR